MLKTLALLCCLCPVTLFASTGAVYFEAQTPAEPGLYDAPAEAVGCDASATSGQVRLVLPDAGIGPNTGLLINLTGISAAADCDPQPVVLEDWHNSKDLLVATVYYRNLAYRFPADFGKLSIGDVLRGTGAVLDAYPVDRRRIYLFGGSGGGHLALQVYQAAPHLWNEVHAHSSITRITTSSDVLAGYETNWNGNLAFPEQQGSLTAEQWERYLAERDLRSPQFHVLHDPRLGATPVWVFHGDADPLVSFRNFLDYRDNLSTAAGASPTALAPTVSTIGNFTFVQIVGGLHAYTGAAPDENSRTEASIKYAPDCFTSVRESAPLESVDYVSTYSNGYALWIRGDIRSATVDVVEWPESVGDWALY